MNLLGRIRNRIAAAAIEAVLTRIPRGAPKAGENKPVWQYTITDEVTGDPYLTRVLFPRVPAHVPVIGGMRPMLHKFHRADVDAALHNHPWEWAASLLLAGEYVEERLEANESTLAGRPITNYTLVRWINFLTKHDYHRVAELRGAVYTLFCTGPRAQSWNFMNETTGKTTEWRAYLDAKKAAAESFGPDDTAH